MSQHDLALKIIASRRKLNPDAVPPSSKGKEAAEGGCGVIGIACSEQIPARHLLQSLAQMRNRGNGKGGGIAAVGLLPEEFGVSREVLQNDTLLAIAYLNPLCRADLERKRISPFFDVDQVRIQPHLADFHAVSGLEVEPPEVVEYFVRPKEQALSAFASQNHLEDCDPDRLADEFTFQNSYLLNREFYASTGDKRAFVLSHGKNMLVLKMVGYGDDCIRYYQVEELHAHIWIGHHRFPTKGRVWHPGGAHPFVGLNEALVHNGDFANYASICEYLAQRNIRPLFLTDTEVSVQVFDLLQRTYGYPLEYVIEALAPTTERDFVLLPPEKRRLYEMLQVTHMHASPDGPWFFLIAQSDWREDVYRLIGITDTSMLRPQVFALQENGGIAVGFAASEKQAIDAALQSLASEDSRFWSRADRYWNARGGSYTDGGAFLFSVKPEESGKVSLACTDKFGRKVSLPPEVPYRKEKIPVSVRPQPVPLVAGEEIYRWAVERLPGWSYKEVLGLLNGLEELGEQQGRQGEALQALTLLSDRRYPLGDKRRSSLLALYDECFGHVLEAIRRAPEDKFVWISYDRALPSNDNDQQTAILDSSGFPPQGNNSLAACLRHLTTGGFRKIMVVNTQGQRFIGNGLGPETSGIRIDVYGSSGDYLASGIDGLEIYVHNNGQDQLAQIMKSGKLVVFGDVGQTFMYGAKGGEAYILGNTAGRPLINAVGRPRVIINGTSLDYLAESFMAGDALNGGGFVVLNGVYLDEHGELFELEAPYPGGNLFSLASGGAIYVRDPRLRIEDGQLNGGEFTPMTGADWNLILPYLEENDRLFGIGVEKLLEVDGLTQPPETVYRKIQPLAVRSLQAEEAWVKKES